MLIEINENLIGFDLTNILGVTKWEPPLNLSAQNAEKPHTLFTKYTEIENMRTYDNIILPGEEVIMTEKIHGSNCRFGYIDETLMAGSHNMRLKPTIDATQQQPSKIFTNKYWYVLNENIEQLLKFLYEKHNGLPIIMYGELYGYKVQDLHYGIKHNKDISFRSFDIKINEKYIDYDDYTALCEEFNVEMVPVLYRGPFSMEKVMEFNGCDSKIEGANNMMEGMVIKPTKERRNPRIGRVILKYVFDRYLGRKNGTEFK